MGEENNRLCLMQFTEQSIERREGKLNLDARLVTRTVSRDNPRLWLQSCTSMHNDVLIRELTGRFSRSQRKNLMHRLKSCLSGETITKHVI